MRTFQLHNIYMENFFYSNVLPSQPWLTELQIHLNSTTKIMLRRYSFKKKSCEFSQGGGSSQNFDIFTTFFACSNLSKSAIKFFCRGSRGTPWPIYFENLDNHQLNIDLIKKFFGFSKEKFSYFAHNGFLVME